MQKLGLILTGIILLGLLIGVASQRKQLPPAPTSNSSAEQTSKPLMVTTDLEVPWAIATLPDGNFLITERPGRIQYVLSKTGEKRLATALSGVVSVGEGGLLGIALSPSFSENRHVYVYYTYADTGNDNTLNRVARLTAQSDFRLADEQVIVDAIPGANNHNGGALSFGLDGNLYVATGDASEPSLAQDTASLAGKILRIQPNGQSVGDNPFGNPVFSYGHRNPQGLAWDDQGRLWATEHGASGYDELNQIEKGKNYGWPNIEGGKEQSGMERPVIHSGDDTWAPSGIAFHDGVLYFSGLRGQALYSYQVADNSIRSHFPNVYGRIRSVTAADNHLYFGTSNRDGRGAVQEGDDRLIRISPLGLR